MTIESDANRLKQAFLKAPLLRQFADNTDKLDVSIPEKGTVRLHLKNFRGLDTNALNTRSLTELTLANIKLSNGHLYMGGADGVSLQYQYSF